MLKHATIEVDTDCKCSQIRIKCDVVAVKFIKIEDNSIDENLCQTLDKEESSAVINV